MSSFYLMCCVICMICRPPPTPTVTDNIVNLFDAFDEVSGGAGNVLLPQTLAPCPPSGPHYLPARLTTPEYGNRWGHMPAEVKVVVKPVRASIQSLEGLVHDLTAKEVGLHHIESIPKTCEVSEDRIIYIIYDALCVKTICYVVITGNPFSPIVFCILTPS